MITSCFRYLTLAAVALVTLNSVSAADLTTFPAQYDALAVTSEVQVEALAGAVAAVNNQEASTSFKSFLDAYSADVADGTLTVEGHNKRIDEFLQGVNVIVPAFSSTADAAIAAAVVDFFKFQLNARAASWDVLYYGANAAQIQLQNPTIDELLQTVDAYMVQNVGSASSAELQVQCDGFLAQAEVAVPGFRDLMYKSIGELYTSLWSQASMESANADGLMESTQAGSGYDGGWGYAGSGDAGSGDVVDDDEAGVSSGSDATTTPSSSMSKENDDGDAPSPSATSAAGAIARASAATIATVVLAYVAMLL